MAESIQQQIPFELTAGQKEGKKLIESTLDSGGQMTLKGYAGTGKTFLVKSVVRDNPGRYAFTAPTNKATRVLKEQFEGERKIPICRTIYSLLGLSLSASGEIKEVTVPDDPIDLSDLDGIFVDEGSMVNNLLFELVTSSARDHNVPLIFMGDPAQLPPVKESASKIWSLPVTFELTEVMRYGGPLLDLATALRKEALKPFPSLPNFQSFDREKSAIRHISSRDFSFSACQKAEDFLLQGKDAAKIICWRNSTVAGYNAMIREVLFGQTPLPYTIGDRVTFTSPFKSPFSGQPLVTTDEEGEVLAIYEEPHPTEPEFQSIRLTLRPDTSPDLKIDVWVVRPESEAQLNRALAVLSSDAKKTPRKWRDFWELKESFAELRHAYAITAHRSQGSTYRETFINMTDILVNRNRQEAFQCLYVAATRAKEKITVC